jgi:predicted small secreted protein
MPRTTRPFIAALALLGLIGCSNTWSGVKQDTRQNVDAVGQGVEKAGEKIQDAAR